MLIVDMGSQYTLIIGRILRELGFRSVILPPQKVDKWLAANNPRGIILSGGSASIYDKNAPSISRSVITGEVPVLGICYGMQLMAHALGGQVTSHHRNKEYGEAKMRVESENDPLFMGVSGESTVWESHGDSVAQLPKGFVVSAVSGETIAAMSNVERKKWGLQFHPEVTHTKEGRRILENFISRICGCQPDWRPADVISDIQNEVLNTAAGKKAIIGFSGGVDSTTLSAILAPVLGKDLLAICIDTGALRKGEVAEIRAAAKEAGVRLKVVRASRLFQKAIGKTTDAEKKRGRFKKAYKGIFEKEVRLFGADFVVQGTLATDIIESGKVGNAALIKSHHNVGLGFSVEELHPFRNLFKYEVRDLAKKMMLPVSIIERQPFPGPGLFLRVIGKPPRPDKLAVVRWADHEVRRILAEHHLLSEISQLIVALVCVPTVGIKGDGRVYKPSVVVRAVHTSDFMTVSGFQIPDEVRRIISGEITKHPGIVRVFFDETNKPPATTEME